MKVISQFVVHLFDLIEAEGRGLRSVVQAEARRAHAIASRMAMGVAVLLISIPLIVGGFVMSAAGLMWWLETVVSRPAAAALTGLALLALGVGCFSCFKLLDRGQQS